jgi:O-antigen/teichoic acid export membrane protein
MIHINADIILLNQLATAGEVAVFKLGSEFYNQLNTLVVSAGLAPMMPVLTSLHARGANERLGEAVLRTARYILWSSLIMAIPLLVYRREVIAVYAGADYLPAADVLGLLLLLFLVMPAGFLLAPLSEAAARMKGLALANVVIQIVKLSVTIYLVKELGWGALGCAISTLLVGGAAHLLVLSPMTLRMAGVKGRRYIDEVLAKGAPPALAGGAIWVLVGVWVAPASWISLALCFAMGGAAYAAALVGLALSAEERDDLVSLIRAAGRGVSFASRRVAQAIGV